jgi:hypothetical protein
MFFEPRNFARKSAFYLKPPKPQGLIARNDENINNEHLDIYNFSFL